MPKTSCVRRVNDVLIGYHGDLIYDADADRWDGDCQREYNLCSQYHLEQLRCTD
jgi:hypothetical protein